MRITAQEFVSLVMACRRSEKIKQELVAKCRADMDIKGVSITDMPGSPNPNVSRIPDVLIRFSELMDQLNEEIQFGGLVIQKFTEFTDMMRVEGANELLIDTVRLRALFCLPWQTIAKETYQAESSLRSNFGRQLQRYDECVPDMDTDFFNGLKMREKK